MSGICPCTMGNSVAGALFQLKKAKDLSVNEPEQNAPATVLSRRVETVYSLTRSSSSWAYLVTFRLESGEEAELRTDEETYRSCTEGKSGSLTWQGGQLTAFT